METKLLANYELARALNVPVSWVRIHSHPSAKNRLPVVKVGRHVRYDLQEVMKWLAEQQEDASNA